MAIDPQSLQILGMVLDRQERRQGAAAERGHEMNMTNLNIAQRNLENQISMNFQRKQNAQAQLDTLRNHFAEIGIKDEFGNPSQLSEMSQRIEGSLIEQSDQIDNIVNLQSEELATLRNMRSAFTRGATTASKFDATFDSDMNIDPESDFGRFRSALNEDDLARMFMEREVDIGETDRERHAFLQGASQVFADTSGLLERERFRLDALNARRAADSNELDRSRLLAEQFRTRHEFAEMIAPDVSGLFTGELATLVNEDATKKEKEAVQNNIAEGLHAGSQSFTREIARSAGIDLDHLFALEESGELSTEQKNTVQYYRQLQQAYEENAWKHINNLTINSQAFVKGIQNSVRELERALESPEINTIEDAIASNAIAASDLGNILGFVGNPYLNPTIGGGFQELNDIMNRTRAQDQLRGYKDFNTALEKATEAFNEDTGIEIGDRLRTTISENLFPELGLGDGDGDPGSGGDEGFLSSLNPFAPGPDGTKVPFREKITQAENLSRNVAGPIGGTFAKIATTPYKVVNMLSKIPGGIANFMREADEKYFLDQAKQHYGDSFEEEANNIIESEEHINTLEEASVVLLSRYYSNN